MQSPPKIVQVLMHEVVKDALADIFAARGLEIVRMPAFDEEDIEAWSVIPARTAPAREQP
ncbi:MAG TPA: hypothetical protein VGN19_05745 [Pedococcus sp.]|nr:hypothetical protein [Pedococcus sp.]